MNWDALGAIGEIVGAAGVIITLLYLAGQVRNSARATESQVHASLASEMQSVIIAAAEDDSIAEALVLAQRGGVLTETQTMKLRMWFVGYLRVCESHVLQRHFKSTTIDLERPIANILKQYAEIDWYRDIMKQAVDRGTASIEFLSWLDTEVLNLEPG